MMAVDFPKFPPDTWGGVYSTTILVIPLILTYSCQEMKFPPKFAQKKLCSHGGVPPTICTKKHQLIDPELRNERFTLISFMGFPAILSTLQPYWNLPFCTIANRVILIHTSQVALIWWGIQCLWQIYMPSLDSKCQKVDFPSHFAPDTWGALFHNFWSWTQKWKMVAILNIFYAGFLQY